MFDLLDKMIKSEEEFTLKLKTINERLKKLVDLQKAENAKRKSVLDELEKQINDLIFDLKRKEKTIDFPKTIGYNPLKEIPCMWETIPWETIPAADRYKAMSLSCPCKKCSPYSMTTHISDGSETFLSLQKRIRESFSRQGHMKLDQPKEE